MDEPHIATVGPAIGAGALRELVRQRRRIPVSTYRFQLHPGFTFRDAAALAPYLHQLGITDCYLSPILQATPGSTHGYDITDHGRLNAELGNDADFNLLSESLAARGMGLILDFVPNHMGIDPRHNRWWRDVLENGPASPFAHFFDIDWAPVKPELHGKVLLPVLGDSYGAVLERGELQLAFVDGACIVRYFDQDLPIDPNQLPQLLRHNLSALQADLKSEDSSLQEFLSVITQLEHLPKTTETAPERVAERQREKEVARERLVRLLSLVPRIRQHVDAAVEAFNGRAGDPASFDQLHALLDTLPYRLAYWRTALHEINYRRFFDINGLAGLRMEDPEVFTAAHALVLALIRKGQITGVRLDHVDGLYDPAAYLQRLQDAVLAEWAQDLAPGASVESVRQAACSWRRSEQDAEPLADRPFYIVVEKILAGHEPLPVSWPLSGTSGYEFLNDVNRLFVDSQQMKRMKQIYTRFTGLKTPFAEIVFDCKKLITRTAMASELNVLAHALNRISEEDRRLRDFTLISLRQALREVVAGLPIYRTFVSEAGASEGNRQMIEVALARARQRNPALESSVFSFVRDALLPQKTPGLAPEHYRGRLDFAMKFQQYTGPVQAKGVEDTAFYRYNLLVSLNEVGGDPQRFGAPPAQFHEANRRRREHWPHGMAATSTHDTKRGEDVRARINVLSEIPDEWGRHLSLWARINARCRTEVDGTPAPDRNDEYLFYQTILGAWPTTPVNGVGVRPSAEFVTRLSATMRKAIKEAKVHTSWINPNEAYDAAVQKFVEQVLTGPHAGRFLATFVPFQRRVAQLGALNSLAQVALKCVAPGVPDFYQGTELWDLNLVDPDNRRPVDFAQRSAYLEELEPLLGGAAPDHLERLQSLLASWHDGRVKLFLTACALRLRRQFPNLFLHGHYAALEAAGSAADRVVALARLHGDECLIAVAPRLTARLLNSSRSWPLGRDVWQDTQIALPHMCAGRMRDLITSRTFEQLELPGRQAFAVADVLADFPVAFLIRANL